MTDEEINIAIAEQRGYKQPFETVNEFFEDGDSDGWVNVLRDAKGNRVPNYAEDLNAMLTAVHVLCRDQQSLFFSLLQDICQEPLVGYITHDYHDDLRSGFRLVHASARQRAEAFLKTLNLWKE